MKYTVIGYYEESGQTWAECVEADDEWGAFEAIAKNDGYPSDVTLIGAVVGNLTLCPPSESGNAVHIADYPGFEERET